MGTGREREEQVDVLIVTAVKDEWDAVLAVDTSAAHESAWEPRPGATGPEVFCRDFTVEGGVLRIAVVQAFGMGREQAVIAAAPLLERHPDVRCLAMCGVCAGRRADVALGDVIVADRTWPYDAGKVKVTVDDQGHRTERFQGDMDLYRIHPPEWKQRAERFQPAPEAPWIRDRPRSYEEQGDWVLERLAKNEDPFAHPDRPARCPVWGPVLEKLWKVKLLERDELKLTEAGHKHIRRRMMLEPDGLREPGPFKVVVGPIASGAPVVQDPTIFERLSDTAAMRKVIGLEMETSAVLALAYLRRVPHAVVMKGVMDYADAFKSDNMKSFAAKASAECLIAFLRLNLPPRETELREGFSKLLEQHKDAKEIFDESYEDTREGVTYYDRSARRQKRFGSVVVALGLVGVLSSVLLLRESAWPFLMLSVLVLTIGLGGLADGGRDQKKKDAQAVKLRKFQRSRLAPRTDGTSDRKDSGA